MPGATEYDAYEREMQLLQYVVANQHTLTVGEIRGRIEALDEVRFNRQKTNRDLAQPDLERPVHNQMLFMG